MNSKILFLAAVLAVGISGCSVNIGSGNNAATTQPVNNTTTSPAAAAKTPTDAAKTPEPAKPATNVSDDPKSETEQIQFAKGETDATLDRTIAPDVSKMFTFNARKGQHVWFKITEPTGKLEAAFNKNDVALGKEVKEMLTSTGDWAIYVYNNTDKPLQYKLWIGIE